MIDLTKILDQTTSYRGLIDEFGKYWDLVCYIMIVIAIIPWVILLLYLVFFVKYPIRYVVDGEIVEKKYYAKGENIQDFEYVRDDIVINKWYIDENFNIIFDDKKMPKERLTVFGRIEVKDV